jgi:hypothetical protein
MDSSRRIAAFRGEPLQILLRRYRSVLDSEANLNCYLLPSI